MKLSSLSTVTILQFLSSPIFAKNDGAKEPRRLKAGRMPKGFKGFKGMPRPSSPLVALIEPFGEESAVLGTAAISPNSDGSFIFTMDVGGLETDGTAVIAEGKTCDTESEMYSETPYFMGSEYEWDGESNYYNALGEGISKSAFRFNNGYGATENEGRIVLVYNDSGEIVGCGPLEKETKRKVLVADMGTYPNYEGDLQPKGRVTATFGSADTFLFRYMIGGLEAECSGCGIHIHAGTSCETHELVKGHGWNSVVVQDLWTAAGGATYNTDEDGNSMGYFYMFNGYGYEENVHHAVVIHGQDGTRLACGVLM